MSACVPGYATWTRARRRLPHRPSRPGQPAQRERRSRLRHLRRRHGLRPSCGSFVPGTSFWGHRSGGRERMRRLPSPGRGPSPLPHLPPHRRPGVCGACAGWPPHRRHRRNGGSCVPYGARTREELPGYRRREPRREQRWEMYRQRGSRFLQAFPDGMSYHSLWTADRSQKKFAAIVRTEKSLSLKADRPHGRSAAAKSPCRRKFRRGPAPASRGLSVKIASSARKISGGRGSRAYGPASRNLPSTCLRHAMPTAIPKRRPQTRRDGLERPAAA